jgi:hypothetical protein
LFLDSLLQSQMCVSHWHLSSEFQTQVQTQLYTGHWRLETRCWGEEGSFIYFVTKSIWEADLGVLSIGKWLGLSHSGRWAAADWVGRGWALTAGEPNDANLMLIP